MRTETMVAGAIALASGYNSLAFAADFGTVLGGGGGWFHLAFLTQAQTCSFPLRLSSPSQALRPYGLALRTSQILLVKIHAIGSSR